MLIPFNTSSFNTGYLADVVIGNIDVTGKSYTNVKLNVKTSGNAVVSAESLSEVIPTLVLSVEAIANAESGQSCLLVRNRKGEAQEVIAIGTVEFADAVIGIVRELFYKGELKPGDQLVIDSDKMTVAKNGINDLKNFEGDFVEINKGKNTVIVNSNSDANIRFRISYRDRFA